MGVNTLQIANRLKAAERDGRAAEEIALVFQEVFEQQLGQLVTKDYLHGELDRLRAEFRAEIAELRAELKGEMAELRTELKGDIAELRSEMAELRGEVAKLRSEMDVLRADMATMEQRITNTLTLRLGAMIVGGVAVLGGLNIFF